MLSIRAKLFMSISWHIGEELDLTTEYIDDIVECQVDGDEWEVIKGMMVNIPYCNHTRTQTFYGDIAKQIVTSVSYIPTIRQFDILCKAQKDN